MAAEQFGHIFIQFLFTQVITSYAQYIQYAGAPIPIPAYVASYPVQSYAPTPVYQPYQPTVYKTPVGASYAQCPQLSANPAGVPTSIYQPTACQTSPYQQSVKATPVVIPELPKPVPGVKETQEKILPKDLLPSAPPFDSNILNNLAIALQLLIVSNLIHNPGPEHTPQPLDEDIFPAISPLPIAYMPPSAPELPSYPMQMPNANFIGTTSFGDTGISKSMMTAYGSPTLPAPRPVGLMSPYDAIGPNSPYLDAFQTKDTKSAYHLTSDYKDLFSLSELFKI